MGYNPFDFVGTDKRKRVSSKAKDLAQGAVTEHKLREMIREEYYKLKEEKLTEAKETIFDVAQRVLDNHQNEKYKGVRIDVQSANLLIKVFKKVKPKVRKHLSDMGNRDPKRLVSSLWALVV